METVVVGWDSQIADNEVEVVVVDVAERALATAGNGDFDSGIETF